jgi:trehalose/maltose hydrolase-like predicted phosphorylase
VEWVISEEGDQEGAMFWDTEIYMLPFYTYTQPDVARNPVRYNLVPLQLL